MESTEEPKAIDSGHPLTNRPFHLTDKLSGPPVDLVAVYDANHIGSFGRGCVKLTGTGVLSGYIRDISGRPEGACVASTVKCATSPDCAAASPRPVSTTLSAAC